MAKLYVVTLSDAERLFLQRTISCKKGTASARTITRARILLKADRGPEKQEWSDTKIAEAVEVSRPTVERLRKRAALEGVEAALDDIALPVRSLVEPHPPLPRLPGNHHADASTPQVSPDPPTTVALVSCHPIGSNTRSSSSPLDGPRLHQRLEDRLFVALSAAAVPGE